jgi:hypothetical protein
MEHVCSKTFEKPNTIVDFENDFIPTGTGAPTQDLEYTIEQVSYNNTAVATPD